MADKKMKKSFKVPLNTPKLSENDQVKSIASTGNSVLQGKKLPENKPGGAVKKDDNKKAKSVGSTGISVIQGKKPIGTVKKDNNKKVSSLTDADYEDLFLSVINRCMSEENSLPDDVNINAGCSPHFDSSERDNVEESAAIPDPNEALIPSGISDKSHICDENDTSNYSSLATETVSPKLFKTSKSIPKTNDSIKKVQKTKITKEQGNSCLEKKNSMASPFPAKEKNHDVPDCQKNAKHNMIKKSSVSSDAKYSVHKVTTDKSKQKSCDYTKAIKKTPNLSVAAHSIVKCNSKHSTAGVMEEAKKVKKHKLFSGVSQSNQDEKKSSDGKPHQSNQSGTKLSKEKLSFSNEHGTNSSTKNQMLQMPKKLSGGVGDDKTKKWSQHGSSYSQLSQESELSCSQGSQVRQASLSQWSELALSQPPPHLSVRERLEWLQKRRDVGLWVQCGRPICNKWRYLADVKDPVEVPFEWFCSMNTDSQHNSCAAPELGPTPLEEEDLIHNLYTAGSMVWGQLAGYPWWPALVDDDPDVEQYYWLNGFSDIPTHYNVVFFDDRQVTRAWLTPGSMEPYRGKESHKEYNKVVHRGINYEKRLKVAKEQAAEAYDMELSERLKHFSFLARYKGPIGKRMTKTNFSGGQDMDTEELYSVSQQSYEDNDGEKKGKKSKRKREGKNNKNFITKKQKTNSILKHNETQPTNVTTKDKIMDNNNKKDKANRLPKDKETKAQSGNCIVPKFSKPVKNSIHSQGNSVGGNKTQLDEIMPNEEENTKCDQINLSQDIFDNEDSNDGNNGKEELEETLVDTNMATVGTDDILATNYHSLPKATMQTRELEESLADTNKTTVATNYKEKESEETFADTNIATVMSNDGNKEPEGTVVDTGVVTLIQGTNFSQTRPKEMMQVTETVCSGNIMNSTKISGETSCQSVSQGKYTKSEEYNAAKCPATYTTLPGSSTQQDSGIGSLAKTSGTLSECSSSVNPAYGRTSPGKANDVQRVPSQSTRDHLDAVVPQTELNLEDIENACDAYAPSSDDFEAEE